MFGNVERIILFHRMVFTTGLREADGQAEKVKAFTNKNIKWNESFVKIHDLLRRRGRDMKIFYGEFCINFKKSNYIISQHQDFVFKLEELANKENRCNNHLTELFQK